MTKFNNISECRLVCNPTKRDGDVNRVEEDDDDDDMVYYSQNLFLDGKIETKDCCLLLSAYSCIRTLYGNLNADGAEC